jgi:hypothetical protein
MRRVERHEGGLSQEQNSAVNSSDMFIVRMTPAGSLPSDRSVTRRVRADETTP